MVRVQSGEILADDSARRIVDLYRQVHGKITALWDHCNYNVLMDIYNTGGGDMLPVDHYSWCITGNQGFGVLGAPGVVYHNLRKSPEGDWLYTMGREENVKLYGGKVVENLCQHVARQIVMWQTARINEKYPVALSVHDEVVCVVPDEDVDDCRLYMEQSLAMAPQWCRGDIPLACETGVGQSYGEAK
jgi:DNA polymerase